MSTLRPECSKNPHNKPVLPDNLTLRGIYKAVKKRRVLGHGKLRSSQGPCAMGCFWDDNPEFAVNTGLIDQVAAVNDSVPPTATRSERRKHVLRWLEWKLGLGLALCLTFGMVKADTKIPPVYVPFSVNYVGGVLANITALKDEETGKFYVFNDLHECREKLQAATEKALMGAPVGGGVVGMCVPVASLDPTTRKTL